MDDRNIWKHLIMCKLFILKIFIEIIHLFSLRIIIMRYFKPYNCLQIIDFRLEYFKPYNFEQINNDY